MSLSGDDERNQPSNTQPKPDSMSSPMTMAVERSSQPASFAGLGLVDELCAACESLGYDRPTSIQSQAIPVALQGRDVIGLAETGSGKTAAFALPVLQALLSKPQAFFCLVLAPTRELAEQITRAFEALGAIINIRCALIVGGMDMMSQSIALGKRPHVIVASPGRLLDHLENTKGFSLRTLKYLILDEADRLLDMDFGPVIEKILKNLPHNRGTYLFSATMSSKVESLQRASLNNPVRISISASKYHTVSTLLQFFTLVPFKDKDLFLIHLVNEHLGHATIIFTRTVNESQRLAILLRLLGFSAIPLHGQLSQSARLGALGKFRSRSRDILVATDVAARGIDIPAVDLVVNFDLPPDSRIYIHRVGRTARAGKSGKAISIVTQYDFEIWQRIETALGKTVDQYPSDRREVMILGERVGEAQKMAIKEMKDLHENRGTRGATLRGKKRGAFKRSRDEADLGEE